MPKLPDLWYDPEHPPLKDVAEGPIRPVVAPGAPPGAIPDIIGYKRTYKNTARTEIPRLQITASVSIQKAEEVTLDPSPASLDAEARRQLHELQVYYDVQTAGEQSSKPDIETEATSDNLTEELREAALVTSFDIELLDGTPLAQTAYVAAVTAYQRCIPYNYLDNYKALRRTEAKAQIQVTSGGSAGARVRLYRNGSSVGSAVDVPGGGPSALVSHNAGVRSTYDMAVRALASGICYINCIMYWTRG